MDVSTQVRRIRASVSSQNTHGNKQAAEDPNPPSSRNDDDHATTIPGLTYHPMPDTSRARIKTIIY